MTSRHAKTIRSEPFEFFFVCENLAQSNANIAVIIYQLVCIIENSTINDNKFNRQA